MAHKAESPYNMQEAFQRLSVKLAQMEKNPDADGAVLNSLREHWREMRKKMESERSPHENLAEALIEKQMKKKEMLMKMAGKK
jgi:hypothetical protein